MKILYSIVDGKIFENGDIQQTETHYYIGTTYYDKQGCNLVDIILPSDFTKETYLYKNNILEKIRITIISKSNLRRRMTYEENYNFSNYEQFIDNQDVSLDVKVRRKGNMKMLTDQFKDSEFIDLNDNTLDTFALIITNCGILTATRLQEILS